jgi:UDP-N-acetylmuramoylalanine--D-glutamate ligase
VITARAWTGKRFGVFGLARTGRSVVDALAASGAEVWAWDDGEAARAAVEEGVRPALEGGEGRVALVNLASADLAVLDGLVVSPGVPLNRHPLPAQARAAGVRVLGDTELFAQARFELPNAAVVGITGTNGKSTTTALVHHILVGAGIDARLGGNIGDPVLGEAPAPRGGAYVFELSSFQIDLTFSLGCEVAVLLNVTPDHLDRYDGMAAYAAAKERLFAMQGAGATAVIATDDDWTRAIARRVRGRLVEVSAQRPLERGVSVVDGYAFFDGDAFAHQRDWPALQGPHNAQNAGCAIAACLALGVEPVAIRAGLASFAGLPHRMELVATIGGVRFINDSKATNAASAAPALAAFPAIHWIAGGKDKGDVLDPLLPFLGNVRAAYLVGEAAERFGALLGDFVPVMQLGVIERAVARAAQAARPGDVVLLSPACASFDQYRDFEERGAAFRAAVEALR